MAPMRLAVLSCVLLAIGCERGGTVEPRYDAPAHAAAEEPTVVPLNVDPQGTELHSGAVAIYDLAATGSAVLWRTCGADGCGVWRRAHADGGVEEVFRAPAIAGFAVSGTEVYVTSGPQVLRVDGGRRDVLADRQPRPRGIAVDATHVYWANGTTRGLDGGGPGGVRGDVRRVRRSGW